MQVITTRSALTPLLLQLRAEGHTIGFVPTMGALHEGHMSLIAESRKRASITVASVFVNPTQFNDPKDLEKYPRQPEKDAQMLEKAGCDYLYLPAVEDVYPEGTQKGPFFDFRGLDTRLEGASRPGHFAGVAQVVKVLVETAVPDFLCMGQKDYQQCMIVSEMLRQMAATYVSPISNPLSGSHAQWSPDLVRLVICPIIREENGLAMSSRNVRLQPELRNRAAAIHATIKYAASLNPFIPTSTIEQICVASLNTLPDFKVDYFLLLDSVTLQDITKQSSDVVVITSVIVGGVRLLDNALVSGLRH
jgi:pantoate--beta-alanine ligase